MTKLGIPLLLVGIAAWLAFTRAALGDYPFDAAPAVEALSHGRIDVYLHSTPVMGPFATIFEAPFSLLGSTALSRYECSCFGCLLVVCGLGTYLGEIARRRGESLLARLVIGILCVANPITFEALRLGHPEELLTAALAVGAVVLAIERQALLAGALLGLAVASKQWAVLAVFPVLMALPARRRPSLLIATGIAVALIAPGLIVAPSSFSDVQGNAASGGAYATMWSVFYPVGKTAWLHVQGQHAGLHEGVLPPLLRPLTHPLIVALMFLVPIAIWIRNRRLGLDPDRVLALLALLALLRCCLDPVDNLYYHAPFILALLAWDAVSPWGRLPMRGMLGVAVSIFFWRWSHELTPGADVFNVVYCLAALAGTVAITIALLRPHPLRSKSAALIPAAA